MWATAIYCRVLPCFMVELEGLTTMETMFAKETVTVVEPLTVPD